MVDTTFVTDVTVIEADWLNDVNDKNKWLADQSTTWTALNAGGDLVALTGNFTTDTGANIWRLGDRVFIGEAADHFAGDSLAVDGGDTWFDTTNYPGYLGINAQLLVTQTNGLYGIVSASRASDSVGNSTIGMGSAAINDKAGTQCWGQHVELQHENGIQSTGYEVAAKNKTVDISVSPATAGYTGVYGIRLFSGGDAAFGGSATNPSACGILFKDGDSTWNTGIVFSETSLTDGEAITFSSEGVGGAHRLAWYDSLGNNVFNFLSTATGSTHWLINQQSSGILISKDDKNMFTIAGAASAVNGIQVFGGATGVQPQVIADGDDTNIDLGLTPKGTGVVQFGTHAAITTETNSGFITIKDAGGTSRKIAVVS